VRTSRPPFHKERIGNVADVTVLCQSFPDVGSHQIPFSNSGTGCQALHAILAGPLVLSAIEACSSHDGVRRHWRIHVEIAVALERSQESGRSHQRIVPAGTAFPRRDDGTFSRQDFRFDKKGDVYFCPQGKILETTGRLVNGGITRLYRASTYDCTPCPLKAQCCPKTLARKIPRDVNEAARDKAGRLPERKRLSAHAISGARSRCALPI
jgi:hypothetical protein